MSVSELTKGIAAMLPVNKHVDTEGDGDNVRKNVVKLRFTHKQYQSFRDACKIFEVISQDGEFYNFVKSALGADVKVQTIHRQLVQPILEAPTRIPIKVPRATKDNEQKRGSYFTNPVPATDKSKRLYARVKNCGIELKQDIMNDVTCITDVRMMMSKYISENDLRNDEGTVLDTFIKNLAPESIKDNNDMIHRINGKLVVPKGDRKVMTGIVNEVTFGNI